MAATQTRAYSAAHFMLELDRSKREVGVFRSVEGGSVKAEVMTYSMGNAHEQWKQLGKPKYEDIKIQCGMAMSLPFYSWIEKFFRGEVERKSGAILAADFYYVERARREFFDAVIAELAFPKLDGGDKGAVNMTVTVSPEKIRFMPGSGDSIQFNRGFQQQKLWTACNFAFILDDFKDACKRITKVDGFSIKQKMIEYHAGNVRDAIKVPGRMEFPNMTFYVPEADAKPFIDHFTNRVINGTPAPSARMHGELQCFDNENKPLCTIDIYGIDLISIITDKSDAGSEDIKQVKIEITTERMEFKYQQADFKGMME